MPPAAKNLEKTFQSLYILPLRPIFKLPFELTVCPQAWRVYAMRAYFGPNSLNLKISNFKDFK